MKIHGILSTLCSLGVLGVLLIGAASAQGRGDVSKGKEIFEQCSVCHAADSTEKKLGPGLKGLFKREKLSNGKPANEVNIREVVNKGGNGMPSYDSILSRAEKDNLIAYLKTL